MDDKTKRIVEALRYCGEIGMVGDEHCAICPAFGLGNGKVTCTDALMSHTADLIEKLSARESAVERDLNEMGNRISENAVCEFCLYRNSPYDCIARDWGECFVWRGVQEEEDAD